MGMTFLLSYGLSQASGVRLLLHKPFLHVLFTLGRWTLMAKWDCTGPLIRCQQDVTSTDCQEEFQLNESS